MYIPHTASECEAMLSTVGVKNLEDLFSNVPPDKRFPKLNLPPALTEMEILSEMQDLAWVNNTTHEMACFLGAGAYNHYIPAAVDSILRRGEYYTAYTPYQPEISQGTLQAIFEYQSQISALTAMDVSNASHYDGATAAAEAVTMADAHFRGKRTEVILSPTLNPQYRQVIRTYNQGTGLQFIGDDQDVKSTPESLKSLINNNTALVYVQYPDFLGRVFDLTALANAVHEAGALFAVSINPIALGILTPPGEFGADIVTGEGQPLGIPLSYGGPYLGIFATRKELVRKMAGRLVGETIDTNGQRAYVLTLTAREQHIRRDKATSNICTNQGLMTLAATVYMSLLGKHGFKQVSQLCYNKAHYAARQIHKVAGYKLWSDTPFFHEFVIHCDKPVEEINQHLLEHNILGGYDLGIDYPSMKNHMLIAVTELNTKEDIDYLVEVLAEVSND